MRAKEFILEAVAPKMPTPPDIPEPNAVDPKNVTDPKAPGKLIDQMSDIANMPVPATISELFQPGKDWEWEFRGSEEAFASFNVGDVEYLWSASVQNKRDPTQWTLAFRQRGQDDQDKMFGMTGTGNSSEVISTVVDITREFLKQYGDKVLEIKFSSAGDSRTSLYAKMVQRLLPDWNLSKRKVGNEFDFLLINPRAYEVEETVTGTQWTGDELYRKLV